MIMRFHRAVVLIVTLCIVLSGCMTQGHQRDTTCLTEETKVDPYPIKPELMEPFQINEEIERKLYDFLDLCKVSYAQYLSNVDLDKEARMESLVLPIYEAFVAFDEDFKSNADIDRRIKEGREDGKYLSTFYIDYTIAGHDILALPFTFDFDSDIDVLLSATNKVSQYFCGIDLFDIE